MITTRKLAHKDELNFSQAVDAGPLADYLVVAVSFRVLVCAIRESRLRALNLRSTAEKWPLQGT